MLYNKLDTMQERPGMFSCETVKDILTFIEGYGSAVHELNLEDKDLEHFSSFNSFVKNKYSINESSAPNWAKIIDYNTVDTRDSFNVFFELLNEYRK